MNIRQFEQQFGIQYPISVRQIRLQEKSFTLQQLHIRAQKWWIHNIIRWRWILPHTLHKNWYQAAISNMIYEPSYISLEWALRYYNLIPEGVFIVTACTSKKTQTFDTIAGTLSYRSLSPRLMFGYELQTIGDYNTIRIATVEKAICDYIYLHPEISGVEDFEEMRINRLVRYDIASTQKLLSYAQHYPKMTQQRIQCFLDYITP